MSNATDTKLSAGTYRLRHEVANPEPDRRADQTRKAAWRSWVKWPAGMTFIVYHDPALSGRARIYARGGYKMDAVSEGLDASYDLLAQALVQQLETPSDLLRRRCDSLAGGYALEILDRLDISVSEIERLIDTIDQEEE